MKAYAKKFERAIHLNGSYLVLFYGDQYGLYAKGNSSTFRNEFRTCLLASGTKEELESWAKKKLYTRKELIDAYQKGDKSSAVSSETNREVQANTVASSWRATGQASNRLQRNKSRCTMFLWRVSPKRRNQKR